jgi:acyl-CoA thioester hydrolase
MKTFKTEARVRYAETDAAEVVYYGSFFIYFEVGKMDMFRELGLSYDRMLPIAETYCKFHAPVRFDDLLEIQTRFADVKEKGFKIESKVFKKPGMELVAEGHTVHIHVDENRKPAKLPQEYWDAFTE